MAGKKARSLAAGDKVSSENRLWALFNPRGQLTYNTVDGMPRIFATRSDAIFARDHLIAPTHVVRLDDITGTVYR